MGFQDYLFLKSSTAKARVTYIPEKPHVRTLKESQHVQGLETILKSA